MHAELLEVEAGVELQDVRETQGAARVVDGDQREPACTECRGPADGIIDDRQLQDTVEEGVRGGLDGLQCGGVRTRRGTDREPVGHGAQTVSRAIRA